jgi:hypothetical protein
MTVEGKPAMGFSIAVEGKDSERTMGGFVALTYNGITQNGFLTNYHVVQAGATSTGTPSQEGTNWPNLESA